MKKYKAVIEVVLQAENFKDALGLVNNIASHPTFRDVVSDEVVSLQEVGNAPYASK